MEFEKYLTQQCEMDNGGTRSYIRIPVYEYIIMQFLDFSYHEDNRRYFFDDPDNNLDFSKPVGTTLYRGRADPYYRFADFIKTFGLIFDV